MDFLRISYPWKFIKSSN